MSTTLTTEKANAMKAYKNAGKEGQKLLADLWPGIFTGSLFERLKTFADVIDEAGANIDDYLVLSAMGNAEKEAMYLKRLRLIEKVFNGDWVADLVNISQRKYYPWFNIIPDKNKPAGFGLSYYDFVSDYSTSDLGARPLFKDSETAIYVGKQFIDEYEAWGQYQQLSLTK